MRVAVIYRPRTTPPPEAFAQLFQAMGEWVSRYQSRMELLGFFVGGGGIGVIDMDDAAEFQRLTAENPFTPFSDVEIHPLVDAQTALRTLQQAFAGG